MAHIVTAPLVITKNKDGSDLYLYNRSVLPDFVSDDEIQRLSDGGFIEELSAEQAKAAEAPKKAPTKPAAK